MVPEGDKKTKKFLVLLTTCGRSWESDKGTSKLGGIGRTYGEPSAGVAHGAPLSTAAQGKRGAGRVPGTRF